MNGLRLILCMSLLAQVSSPVTVKASRSATNDSGPIAWDPAALTFGPECATSRWATPRQSLCMVEPVLDKSGQLHIFMAQRPLLNAVVDRHIEHLLISDKEVHRLPAIPVEHAPAIAFRAVATQAGDLQLLWVEDHYWDPGYHPQAMYLETYHAGAMRDRRPVLDDKTRPVVWNGDDIALRASEDGSLDVFWKDDREHHRLAGFLSVCDDGHRSKTYHRRLTGDHWGDPERVQPKGLREPVAFRVAPAGTDPPDVYWSDTVGSVARVFRSGYSQGQWKVDEPVGQCKADLDRPDVFDLSVISDAEGHARVAWICNRFEYTVPGTKRNDLFGILYLSEPGKTAWTTGPEISHNASHLRWLWDSPRQSVLLVQEWQARTIPFKVRPVPLMIVSADTTGSVTKTILAKESVEDFGESIADSKGTIHVIYAEPTSDTEAILKYRRGVYQGD